MTNPIHPLAGTADEVRAFEAASAKAVPDVRAEFEAWVTTVDDHPLTRLGDGYNWHSIQAKWELWKSACAALAAAPAADARTGDAGLQQFLGAAKDAGITHLSANFGKALREHLETAAAPAPVATLSIPEECPHLIWFDDQDMRPLMFAGCGAKEWAVKKWDEISAQWNAHLFVRIAVNSRDAEYPNAAPYVISNPAAAPVVPKWIDDPHDIEQGQMLNPEWVKQQEADMGNPIAQQNQQVAAPVVLPEPVANVAAAVELALAHGGRRVSAYGKRGDPVLLYPDDLARLLAGVSAPEVQAGEVLGWVHKTKSGKIGHHFYTYEPHCDTSVRDDGGEKIAVVAATAPQEPAADALDAARADARDAAFEAVRKAFCKLQRYSFFLDDKGNVRRTADYCGNWVEFEAVHTLFEPAAVDAAIAAAKGNGQ